MMLRRFALTALAFGVLGGHAALAQSSAPSHTQHCRDAKGKFTKCEKKPTKPKPCRDAKGKFTKCETKPAANDTKASMKSNMPDANMPADTTAK